MDTSKSDAEFQPRDVPMDALNQTVNALDCTPVKAVRPRDKIPYGKRKLKQIRSAAQAKCAAALELSPDTLESTETETECSNCRDLDRFVVLLKEKLRISPRQEQIKLLTLAPESWSQQKVMNEFDVSHHMVKTARRLKKDKGILSSVSAKKGRPLNQEIVDRIVDFYQSDEYTRMCPGQKDFVVIRTTEGKEYRQKRLLLINLRELFMQYKNKYPTDKVGFAKFCELRPKWCLPVTATGMHAICVCQHHQNVKLLIAALPENIDYKDLLSKIVCSLDNRRCMIHLCDLCNGKTAVQEYLSEMFASHEYDNDDTIAYKQWLHTDRTTIVNLTTTVQEFIQITTDALDGLRQHHYISKAQSKFLAQLKDSIAPDEAIILLDFAENYSFIVQDAVQGQHWDNTQATLHPFVVYYRSGSDLQSSCICVISDCLKHDTLAVHAFIATVLPCIKQLIPSVNKLFYFSDGAASQYKNFKNFLNLCHHENDHGLKAEWHFFATSHGKSPCDGVGGTVKRLVARASLQATVEGHILTPFQMFNWATTHISGITFHFVSKEDVAENAIKYDLVQRFTSTKTVAGTRSHHGFIPFSEKEMKMKRVSDDEESTNVVLYETTASGSQHRDFQQKDLPEQQSCNDLDYEDI